MSPLLAVGRRLRQSLLHRSGPRGRLLLDVADEDDEERDDVVDLQDVGAGVVEQVVEVRGVLGECSEEPPRDD